MEIDIEREKVIEQLERLNEKMERQLSLRRTFGTGIIYGIGFFLGSVIIASVAFGLLAPWVGQIDWIRDNFERGASLGE